MRERRAGGSRALLSAATCSRPPPLRSVPSPPRGTRAPAKPENPAPSHVPEHAQYNPHTHPTWAILPHLLKKKKGTLWTHAHSAPAAPGAGAAAVRAGGRGQGRRLLGWGWGGGGSGGVRQAGEAAGRARSRRRGGLGGALLGGGTGREPAMDATTLELDAVKFAQLAVQRDQSGRYQEAVFYYKVRRGLAAAGSLRAPVSPSPSPRASLRPLSSWEVCAPPLSPQRAGRGGEEWAPTARLGPSVSGRAVPCRAGGKRSAGLALPQLLPSLGGYALETGAPLGLGEDVAVPAERKAEGRACTSESLPLSGGAASFRAGCETRFPCVLFSGGNKYWP